MRAVTISALWLCVAACSQEEQKTYTIYRNSPLDSNMRIHFATFDARDKGVVGQPGFNQENCDMTVALLNENVGRLNGGRHPAKFWCEKGTFRP